MLTRQLGLAGAILGANVRSPALPYKVTFVATYHCNFRCEMCNIWQKKSVNEMTPEEVGLFFDRWPQFRWVHLTGGELFMRRDLDDLVAAIQKNCRSLFLLNFPTTGWFGDKTVSLVERTLARGVGRLMVTISIDGPKALHEEMRGLPGSFDKGLETFRRLRGIRASNFQTVIGMTLMAKNADARRRDARRDPPGHSGFPPVGAAPERRPRVGALLRQRRLSGRAPPCRHPARGRRSSEEERLVAPPGEVPRGPVSGAHRQVLRDGQVAAAVHGAVVVVLRRRVLEPVSLLDLEREGRQPARQRLRSSRALGQRPAPRELREDVVEERCSHCWTPCEAYPTILGHLARAAVSRGPAELQPIPAETR